MKLRIQDSPEQHFTNGMRLFIWGKLEDAQREFTTCLSLDPMHPGAFTALGLLEARNGHFLRARLSLAQAASLAETPSDKGFVQCGYIYLYTRQQGKDWLGRARRAFDRAARHLPGSGDPWYFMGLAYEHAYRFVDAEHFFTRAEGKPGYFSAAAASELNRVAAIRRLAPRSRAGKRVVLKERIDRADLAVLLVHELHVERLVRRAEWNPSGGTEKMVRDIGERPDHGEIERIVRLGIEGICLYPDRTFRPETLVTRSEMAVVLQSILIQAVEDPSLSYRFADRESSFPDVFPHDPFYNAVVLMSTWGIMKAGIPRTGEFDPLGTISGIEALEILQRFKQILAARGRPLSRRADGFS